MHILEDVNALRFRKQSVIRCDGNGIVLQTKSKYPVCIPVREQTITLRTSALLLSIQSTHYDERSPMPMDYDRNLAWSDVVWHKNRSQQSRVVDMLVWYFKDVEICPFGIDVAASYSLWSHDGYRDTGSASGFFLLYHITHVL